MKKNLLILALLVIGSLNFAFCNAQSEGPNRADTIYDNPATGQVAWKNPMNAIDSDGRYATDSLNSTMFISHYLEATGFNFSIPSNAAISGITVQILGHDSAVAALGFQNFVYLVKNNVIQHDSILGIAIADTDTWQTFGSCSNTWNDTTWTYSDINSPDFGVVYSARGIFTSLMGTLKVYLNEIRTTICYTIPSSTETYTQTSNAGSIYPNPSHGEIGLNYKGNYLLQVYDLAGKEVYHSNLEGPQYIDLSFLSAGMYFIHITSGKNSEIRKLVIEK